MSATTPTTAVAAAAQKMREENLKRKRLEARLKLEIFQKQQEQIAKLRGDLERAALKKDFDKRNLKKEKFLKEVSIHCLGLLERYDYRQDKKSNANK